MYMLVYLESIISPRPSFTFQTWFHTNLESIIYSEPKLHVADLVVKLNWNPSYAQRPSFILQTFFYTNLESIICSGPKLHVSNLVAKLTWNPSYAQEPSFMLQIWSSNGKYVMSTLHELRKRTIGGQKIMPSNDTIARDLM